MNQPVVVEALLSLLHVYELKTQYSNRQPLHNSVTTCHVPAGCCTLKKILASFTGSHENTAAFVTVGSHSTFVRLKQLAKSEKPRHLNLQFRDTIGLCTHPRRELCPLDGHASNCPIALLLSSDTFSHGNRSSAPTDEERKTNSKNQQTSLRMK